MDVNMIVVIVIVAIVVAMMSAINKQRQLKKYIQIRIGMSEKEMLKIMGGGYNVSSLKNNRRKYEWRINGSSYGSHGMRSYSGVKKVDIYTKNGMVEEIRPYNV